MLPNLGGGSQLGVARGSIRIDTSDADRARATMQRIGADIRGSMTGAGSAIDRFAGAIRSMRLELVALGAAGGIITKMGLDAARNMRAFRVAFSQLTGSVAEGDKVMARLVESANEFGLEIEGVLQLSRSLLPVLEGNTDELDEWVKRAALLRSTFPIAQKGAETRAISEFLAGQTMSLQRLFNIAPNVILEAQRLFDDYGDQLDYILERQGATEEGARQMADAFVSLRNELTLALSTAFTPLFGRLQELAVQFREFVTRLRETNPAALEAGASIAAIAAVGAPALLFVGQMIESIGKLRKTAAGGILLKIGIAAGAAALVTEGVQAIGRATGNEHLANITFAQMIGDALKTVADMFLSWEALVAASFNGLVSAIASGIEAVGGFVQALGEGIQALSNMLPERFGGRRLREMGEGIVRASENITGFSEKLREANEIALQTFLDRLEDARNRIHAWANSFFGIKPRQDSVSEPTGGTSGGIGRLGQLFRDTIENAAPGGLVAWTGFWADMQQIQRDAEAEILAAEAELGQQRAEIIASFELMMAREQEDFNRQRARAEEDLQRQINEINADRVEREAEWQEELNERIAEINAKAARDRERMEEDHRDNLLSAASRLDARAVAEENRRFARQISRFDEDLQERIDGEREAHRERVANAREADEKRIADLQAFHDRRKAREDEDREIRLARMQEDHERQLEQFDEQAGKRIQQIKDQAADERAAAADAYRDRLREQGIYYTSFLTEQARRQGDSLRSWQDFWDDFQRTQRDGQRDGRTGGDSGRGGTSGGAGGTQPSRRELETQAIDLMQQAGWDPRTIYNKTRMWRTWTDAQLARWMESTFGVDVPGYALGIDRVPQTGLAMLHRGEMVIDPRMAAIIRAQTGPEAGVPRATMTGSSSVVKQFGDVHLHVQGAQNMTEQQFENALIRALTKVSA